MLFPYSGLADYRFDRLVKYVAEGNLSTATFFLVMNKQAWEKLSAADRRLFEELSGERLSLAGAQAFEGAAAKAVAERVKPAGIHVYRLPPDELGRWKQAVGNTHRQWVEDLKAKGLPAAEVYDRAVNLAGEK